MTHYTLRRLAQLVPTFLGITVLAFVLLLLAPGDPATVGADELSGATAGEALAQWRALKGGNQSIAGQYLHWLWGFVRLDFGRSLIDERPVRELLVEALPRTLLLCGLALVLTYAFAIPLGFLSALRRGRWADRVLSGLSFVLYAMPPFWVALGLVVLFSGGEFWQLFPLRGLTSPGIEGAGLVRRGLDLGWHLVLPVACLTYPAIARTSRYQRSAVLEVIGQDYVRAARAKGLSERAVLLRHVLKNALVPMVNLLGVDLPWIVGGSVLIERIFTIRGMGMLTFDAILRRDYPVVLGVVAVVALVSMVATLAADLLCAWLDPRLRTSSTP